MRLPLLLLVAGCAPSAEQRCSQAIDRLCEKQVECGTIASARDCVYDYEELYVCDPAATQAAYAACTGAVEAAECGVVQPSECSAILCDRDLGCDATAPGCREPGATTTELPICDTGG